MTDELTEPQNPQDSQETEPTSTGTEPGTAGVPSPIKADPKKQRPYKLSRKHKAFADAYLLTLNASEAYRVVFKPKHPEYAYKRAYAVLKDEGVSRYIDEALQESTDAEYRPEAIKQGIRNLAMTAKRESDRLRAYELMSKISGLLTEGVNNTQVNFITDDIMQLAKKRLQSKVSQVIEGQHVTTDSPKPNVLHDAYYRTLDAEGDAIDSSLVQEKDRPRGEGMADPPPTPESNSKPTPQ